MGTTTAIGLVKIPVSDVEKAAPFYRDVLGLDEEFVVAEFGWAQFQAGNLGVALYVPGKGGGHAKAGESDHVHFTVPDFDAFKATLKAHGIDPDAHLHTSAEGTQHFELTDVDGNTFKVMQAST